MKQEYFSGPDDMSGFQALLDSPEGKPKWNDSAPSVSKQWVLETTWTDCPEIVIREVKEMWADKCAGNDYYYVTCCLDQELYNFYPHIYMWARYNGIQPNESFLVHYWW